VPATCPTCGGPIPVAWTGRPRTYCSSACRVEMAHRRRELIALEEELVETRYRLANGWALLNRGHVTGLERAVAAARARIPEEMQ
jgi:cell division protein FtsL